MSIEKANKSAFEDATRESLSISKGDSLAPVKIRITAKIIKKLDHVQTASGLSANFT